MSTQSPHILAIYNPVCGHARAKSFFHASVIPLLIQQDKHPAEVVETTHPNHAAEVLLAVLADVDGPVVVVLGSGDGTLHEIVCALDQQPPSTRRRDISFVLVPCGTANALYSSLFPETASDLETDAAKLKSLHAFLASTATTRPLTLARTTLTSPAASTSARPSASISIVVASTALHASILHDSEVLRPTHPGIERFKIAAQQNITRWYDAHLRLWPASAETRVQRYNVTQREFVPVAADGAVELDGPFAYFLSTVNVDRLEPAFRIAPLHTALPPSTDPEAAVLDVVILRPRRDPTINDASAEAKAAFANKGMAVLGAAYRDGAHIHMRYADSDGSVVEDGDGESVVEYFRCGKWEWIPAETDPSAHLVCADGEILHIEAHGSASCAAMSQLDGYTLSVHV